MDQLGPSDVKRPRASKKSRRWQSVQRKRTGPRRGFRGKENACPNRFVSSVNSDVQTHEDAEPTNSEPQPCCSGSGSFETRNVWIHGQDKLNKTADSERQPCFSGNSTPSTSSQTSHLEVEFECENTKDEEIRKLHGRRICNVQYFFEQIASVNHSPFNCTFRDLAFIKESRSGFLSSFIFQCKMCGIKETFHNENVASNFNRDVVQAVVCSGSGFSQIDEICAHLDMPCMSEKTFIKENMSLGEIIKDVALKSMYDAGLEEKEIAIKKGQVDSEGIPLITVVADAAWGKRSYRTSNYNSLSGVACIMGYETKKVLFLGIRNSYCCICTVAKNKNKDPKQHKCFKNWAGTSTAMEADGIVEGFKCSLDMHGVKYIKLIGDGDSSVMSALNEAQPYGHTTVIQKIECSNHLLRNYCTKLRNLAKKTENRHGPVPVLIRKCLSSNVIRLRKAIKGAVDHTSKSDSTLDEKVKKLKEDILNGPCHVFGEHKNCDKYYCKGAKVGEENFVNKFKECGLWYEIYTAIHPITNNIESLLIGQTNNIVEQFNALIAKFISGKRINYSLRGSYDTRCYAAAAKKNTGSLLKSIHKASRKTGPLGSFSEKYENKMQNLKKRKSRSSKNSKKARTGGADEFYGNLEKEEDISEEEFARRKHKLLDDLKKTPDEINLLEKMTIGQSVNPEWVQQRKMRITASMFGQICKMRPSTSCQSIIKTILYSTFKGSDATRYGTQNEQIAIKEFENVLGQKITSCGLFIDYNNSYLGASPDGLIGEDSILEIKCPAVAANITPAEAIRAKKIKFCELDEKDQKTLVLKRNHNYYYQVQGQLNITNRKYCFFVVWTPKGILYEKIQKDSSFWESGVRDKLRNFYMECLLPEIIDPRLPRKLPIRDRKR